MVGFFVWRVLSRITLGVRGENLKVKNFERFRFRKKIIKIVYEIDEK